MLKELKIEEIKEIRGGKGNIDLRADDDCNCNCGTVAKSQADDMATFASIG
jgi:hypothetical protein